MSPYSASATAAPEPQIICRSFRDAFAESAPVILQGRPGPDQLQDFALAANLMAERLERAVVCVRN